MSQMVGSEPTPRHMKAVTANWCLIGRTCGGGGTPCGGGGYTRSTDCLPIAGATASTCGLMTSEHSIVKSLQIDCLGFRWIYRNFNNK